MENMSIIKEKLDFKEITVDMRREVERYTKSAGLFSSEFTFTSYMAWGGEGQDNDSLRGRCDVQPLQLSRRANVYDGAGMP